MWMDISDYEGLYKVSNSGLVKNRDGKILRHSYAGRGYPTVALCKDGKPQTN